MTNVSLEEDSNDRVRDLCVTFIVENDGSSSNEYKQQVQLRFIGSPDKDLGGVLEMYSTDQTDPETQSDHYMNLFVDRIEHLHYIKEAIDCLLTHPSVQECLDSKTN